MSIEDELLDRISRNMLFPLAPQAPGEVQRRVMLIGEKLWGALQSPEGDAEWEQRIGELRADLEVFVTEPTVDPKYLFLLYRAEEAVWEIRSTGSDPSIRVLGLFPSRDVFVAVDFALRSDLGGWQSRAWKAVKRNAKAVWRALLDPYQPIVTINVNDVVSGALDGRYFK